MFYSAIHKGFFSRELHGDAVPEDAVPVSAADYAALFTAQAQGAQIVPGEGGAPTLLWPTPPTPEEVLEAWRARTVVSAFQAKAALYNRGNRPPPNIPACRPPSSRWPPPSASPTRKTLMISSAKRP